ncbi:hypothetical protein KY289_000326 [Solanum tuberosum]|nr:hypothetical protein KY289_000326 [Solanum tuberosum]
MVGIDSHVLGEQRGSIPRPQGRFLAGNGAGTALLEQYCVDFAVEKMNLGSGVACVVVRICHCMMGIVGIEFGQGNGWAVEVGLIELA